jgi:uncharacterized protein
MEGAARVPYSTNALTMTTASRAFQVFAKPAGSACNLACRYCYYLGKEQLFPDGESLRMPDDILEAYMAQHIDAAPGSVVSFSWHGGEPTILGLDYFRKIVALQRRLCPPGRRIVNGMQTNGTLLDEDWCRFLAAEGFAVGISLDGPQGLHDGYRVTRGQHPSFEQAMRGYALVQRHQIPCNVLCVVHAQNVQHPTEVYRFFKQLEARYVEFLPLVEPQPDETGGVSSRSVPASAWGDFLCTVFDEWMRQDIERVQVQLFEEVARTALGQEHALCIFRGRARRRAQRRFLLVRSLRGYRASSGEYPGDAARRSARKSGAAGIRAGQAGRAAPLLPGV